MYSPIKQFLSLFFLLSAFILNAQTSLFPEHLKNTQIAKLHNNDSIIYYQCHVDEATQETTTSTGQKIVSKKKKLTITEKFVIIRKDTVYTCKYYILQLPITLIKNFLTSLYMK